MTFKQLTRLTKGIRMDIKSVVYVDANGNEYPVKVNGCNFSSAEELEFKLAIYQGMNLGDTISIRIVDNNAEIGKGDPVEDKDDVTYVHSDANGNVTLNGYGG